MEQINKSDVVRLEIPAAYNYLNLLGSCVRAFFDIADGKSQGSGVAYNVELAVHEACTNIVEHAYAGLPGRSCLGRSRPAAWSRTIR
jgi:serine/threonine-protein kinase RsbW